MLMNCTYRILEVRKTGVLVPNNEALGVWEYVGCLSPWSDKIERSQK